jgi:hypothetical protein
MIQKVTICPEDICCTLFSLMSFSEVSHVRFLTRQQCANALNDNDALFLHIFSHWVFRVLTRHVFVMVFVQG